MSREGLVAAIADTASFQSNAQRNAAHLKSFKLGGIELEPVLTLVKPHEPSARDEVAGIVTFSDWDGKVGSILTLEGVVTSKNKKALQEAIENREKEADGELAYFFYTYDLDAKKFYACCGSDTDTLEIQLSKKAPSFVKNEKVLDYDQIAFFPFTLSLVAADTKDQHLTVANAYQAIKKMPWGQKRA